MRLKALIYIAVILILFPVVQAKEVIRYPQAGEIYNKHHQYPIALLELALKSTDIDYSIEPSRYFMTQGRAIKQLNQQQDIDVLWTMTSLEREQLVKPIRIPIYKGLIGWRLFLTNTNSIAMTNKRIAPDRLRYLVMIQGHDWPDTDILHFNGFNVHTGTDYLGLFKILSLGRADLFPRSIIEIWDELETHPDKLITLEQGNVISYPTATYFFVAPDNHELAKQIETGLRTVIANGEFDRLFIEYYGDIIEKANLNSRTHHRLMNPLLPEQTPLNEKSLWFSLDSD